MTGAERGVMSNVISFCFFSINRIVTLPTCFAPLLFHLFVCAVGKGASATEIVGPGDIEVHKGSDGRLYLLDPARLFPPEVPPANAAGMLLKVCTWCAIGSARSGDWLLCD